MFVCFFWTFWSIAQCSCNIFLGGAQTHHMVVGTPMCDTHVTQVTRMVFFQKRWGPDSCTHHWPRNLQVLLPGPGASTTQHVYCHEVPSVPNNFASTTVLQRRWRDGLCRMLHHQELRVRIYTSNCQRTRNGHRYHHSHSHNDHVYLHYPDTTENHQLYICRHHHHTDPTDHHHQHSTPHHCSSNAASWTTRQTPSAAATAAPGEEAVTAGPTEASKASVTERGRFDRKNPPIYPPKKEGSLLWRWRRSPSMGPPTFDWASEEDQCTGLPTSGREKRRGLLLQSLQQSLEDGIPIKKKMDSNSYQ